MTYRKTREIIPDNLPDQISQLRHPLEWPAYVLAAVLAPFLVLLGFFGGVYGSEFLFFVVFGAVVLIVFREIYRRLYQGNAIQVSQSQFPEIYDAVHDFSEKLGLKKVPDVFVVNGQGAVNAGATETWGKAYIIINSEIFSDQPESISHGLRFVIGHELGHIRLWHTNLIYRLFLIPWEALSYIPLFGMVLGLPYNLLSRFKEYSCDRIGASLVPDGVNGLVLLAAGRYVYERVDLADYLEQTRSRETMGRWTGAAELLSTHPFISNRIRNLYELGFWVEPSAASGTSPETSP